MNFTNTWNKMVGFFIIGKKKQRKLNERLIKTLEFAKSEFERLYDEIDSYHKPGFPYYRKVCGAAYTEPGEYQCLACKHIHYYENYLRFEDIKYCSKCGIEFVGEFTKKNKRYNGHNTCFPKFKHPGVTVSVKTLSRKYSMSKTNYTMGDHMLSVENGEYAWETEFEKTILPFCQYMSAKDILDQARKYMQKCKPECRTIQLWAKSQGKERLIKEIRGGDMPRKPKSQIVPPSFFGGFYNPLNPQQLRNF